MKDLDVRGLNCPEPALMVKNEINKKECEIRVLCDCGSAEENIFRLAQNNNYKIEKTINGDKSVTYILRA